MSVVCSTHGVDAYNILLGKSEKETEPAIEWELNYILKNGVWRLEPNWSGSEQDLMESSFMDGNEPSTSLINRSYLDGLWGCNVL
jgi:hypothetical protein